MVRTMCVRMKWHGRVLIAFFEKNGKKAGILKCLNKREYREFLLEKRELLFKETGKKLSLSIKHKNFRFDSSKSTEASHNNL